MWYAYSLIAGKYNIANIQNYAWKHNNSQN